MVDSSYGNLGGEITANFLKVAEDLWSSHVNHLDVEVLRRKLLFLRVAKYPGLA